MSFELGTQKSVEFHNSLIILNPKKQEESKLKNLQLSRPSQLTFNPSSTYTCFDLRHDRPDFSTVVHSNSIRQ